jgi:hypothetical protein
MAANSRTLKFKQGEMGWICGSVDLWICGSVDLRDLRDLNPRLLVLSPYAVELAPQ